MKFTGLMDKLKFLTFFKPCECEPVQGWRCNKWANQHWKLQSVTRNRLTKFGKFRTNFMLWWDTTTEHLTSTSWVIFFKVLSVSITLNNVNSPHIFTYVNVGKWDRFFTNLSRWRLKVAKLFTKRQKVFFSTLDQVNVMIPTAAWVFPQNRGY